VSNREKEPLFKKEKLTFVQRIMGGAFWLLCDWASAKGARFWLLQPAWAMELSGMIWGNGGRGPVLSTARTSAALAKTGAHRKPRPRVPGRTGRAAPNNRALIAGAGRRGTQWGQGFSPGFG